MDVLGFATLTITGFTSCAEFGSYAFVHPVIRRLPPEQHLQVEKGLLGTFGRVMPMLMTLCVALSVTYAVTHWQPTDRAAYVRGVAALSFVTALVSTLIYNVPINAATARWSVEKPPPDWKETRNRWEFFQTVRSGLLLLGFVLLCLAAALQTDERVRP
jgi:uncharacterized membrane protein